MVPNSIHKLSTARNSSRNMGRSRLRGITCFIEYHIESAESATVGVVEAGI